MNAQTLDTIGLSAGIIGGAIAGISVGSVFPAMIVVALLWTGGYLSGRASAT